MKTKIIYFYELILALFIVALKFIFIDKLENYYKLVLVLFWVLSFALFYSALNVKKNNTILKRDIVSNALISILLFFIVIYLSGLFFGFLGNSYSLRIPEIFKNTFHIIIMIISQEYIRYSIASNVKRTKMPLIILTILFILLEFILVYSETLVGTKMNIFIFVTTTILPIIARHIFYTYTINYVDYIPNLIIRLPINLYIYLIPIIPDLGHYINSVIGIVFPYLVYLRYVRLIKIDQQVNEINKKVMFINIPLVLVLGVLIILISGVFKYQIMAIGSGSMHPIYDRGDAVIFEKIEDDTVINLNEILVFRYGAKVVTHRLIEIEEVNGELMYQTKGDANVIPDDFKIRRKDIIGVVKAKVKFIGYPSIWFQDLVS